jgi:predicted signal transduction protein with EAL and GGDEF domain
VETEDQLAFLRKMQCDEAQGYLLSKPLASTEVRQLLQAGVPLISPADSELDHVRTEDDRGERARGKSAKVVSLS